MENPAAVAKFQSQASSDVDWSEMLQRIMALTTKNARWFASQPFANRVDAILEAVVPSRKNPTHEKVLTIVNALLETKAIRPDETGGMYNALLERVSKYNSLNVQSNLEKLGKDVRNVIAMKEKSMANNLGSVAALNSFIGNLPATVERGQDNYLAFLSALRLLVAEIPSAEVYRSGPDFYLQTSHRGATTVNLTKAMNNLQPLWGVQAPVAERNSISSILTPNTRLLLLIVAPFSDNVSISRSSYIGYLLGLYRETLGQTAVDERTYEEISSVSKALGNAEEDAANLQATLNFLLTNRKLRIPKEYQLTDHEERILRYIQQAVSMLIMSGTDPSLALDEVSRNFEPSFYSSNRVFINRLMDYFHRAASIAPNYFINAVLNSKWNPPEGFFTGIFDFPEDVEQYDWDSLVDDALGEDQRSASYQQLGAYAIEPLQPTHKKENERAIQYGSLASMSTASKQNLASRESMVLEKATNVERAATLLNNEMDNIVKEFSKIKTHRQEMKELEELLQGPKPPPPEEEENEEDWRKDRYLKFEGKGLKNMFSHLKPKGQF
ncbi:pIIIa [Bottlenose dolphin adenovirus 1]|uniref:PIIIa n=1 Tax=Bottlenose dolphin adenovirus 1 TaxID=1714377 RepID=A0A1X7MNZ8_9ADEN|nr:pIIIa [Bottlenose dolphin adenovirus 1]SMG83443.1 pIIIa [Bottlenose dolphin adenovirus 1]